MRFNFFGGGYPSCVFFVLFFGVVSGFNITTVVHTTFGTMYGFFGASARSRLVLTYLGVPYAEPPVGELRFRDPRPWNHKWNKSFGALGPSKMCIQMTEDGKVVGNEDCLYLNIYKPVISEEKSASSALPVMVYVHGGKFKTGGNDMYKHPPRYMMDQNVILVVLNYRLSIFGFLTTASKASPGNYGLKDVVLALRWVQRNIAAFNGDPNNVTLWGHSSGAAIVHALALTNKTEGLFHRYILQSGNMLCPWAISRRETGRMLTITVAASVGCFPNQTRELEQIFAEKNFEMTENGEEEVMKCLRNVDAGRIAKLINRYSVWMDNPCCVFGPVIEEEAPDAVITEHPFLTIKKGLFRDIPFIAGITEHEGLIKTIDILTKNKLRDEFLKNYEAYLPDFLEYHQLIDNTSVFADIIKGFYFDGTVNVTLTQNFTNLAGDALMIWPMYETVVHHSNTMKSNIYFFLFSYQGTFSSTFHIGNSNYYGVSHTDDLNYLIPLLNVKYSNLSLHNTKNDETIINVMTEMWANFAITGVPSAWKIPNWPDFKATCEFLRIGDGNNTDIKVENTFLPGRMRFWEEFHDNVTIWPREADSIIEPTTPVSKNGTFLNFATEFISLLVLIVLGCIVNVIFCSTC